LQPWLQANKVCPRFNFQQRGHNSVVLITTMQYF
jgi:hypothetical protein